MKSSQQVAVITGAASGIGLALAEVCIQRGIHIVMADNAELALSTQQETLKKMGSAEVVAVRCDVTKPDDLQILAQKTYEHFNRVDWVFNNAGISGQLAPIWELPNEHIHEVMEVNLYGIIYGIKAFLPYLFKQSQRSHIINMASFYGLCSGSKMAAYAMSKHAILALSESLYFDLKRLEKPVGVSVVCPSFANTALLANSSQKKDAFHGLLTDLIARARPAFEVARHIVSEVENNTFYILPDKEVKDYCEQRTKAIIEQSDPHKHSLEKIFEALAKRA